LQSDTASALTIAAQGTNVGSFTSAGASITGTLTTTAEVTAGGGLTVNGLITANQAITANQGITANELISANRGVTTTTLTATSITSEGVLALDGTTAGLDLKANGISQATVTDGAFTVTAPLLANGGLSTTSLTATDVVTATTITSATALALDGTTAGLDLKANGISQATVTDGGFTVTAPLAASGGLGVTGTLMASGGLGVTGTLTATELVVSGGIKSETSTQLAINGQASAIELQVGGFEQAKLTVSGLTVTGTLVATSAVTANLLQSDTASALTIAAQGTNVGSFTSAGASITGTLTTTASVKAPLIESQTGDQLIFNGFGIGVLPAMGGMAVTGTLTATTYIESNLFVSSSESELQLNGLLTGMQLQVSGMTKVKIRSSGMGVTGTLTATSAVQTPYLTSKASEALTINAAADSLSLQVGSTTQASLTSTGMSVGSSGTFNIDSSDGNTYVGGALKLNTYYKDSATGVQAATLNAAAGRLTFTLASDLNAFENKEYTITNSMVDQNDLVIATIQESTSNSMVVTKCKASSGGFTLSVMNSNSAMANGSFVINFMVIKGDNHAGS